MVWGLLFFLAVNIFFERSKKTVGREEGKNRYIEGFFFIFIFWLETNKRPGTGHVTSGPMRGLERNCTLWPGHIDRHLDMATLWQWKSCTLEITQPLKDLDISTKNKLNYWIIVCRPYKGVCRAFLFTTDKRLVCLKALVSANFFFVNIVVWFFFKCSQIKFSLATVGLVVTFTDKINTQYLFSIQKILPLGEQMVKKKNSEQLNFLTFFWWFKKL